VRVVEKSLAYRTLRQTDEVAVESLVESTFSSFLRGEFWGWKYRENPGFDYSLVAVAEDHGKVVGCNHWLRRRFKVSTSVEVDGVLAADIAVSPDYRKMGIGRALLEFLRSSDAMRNEKFAVIYMFANPDLSKRLYKRVGGYVPAPDTTVAYTKVLNWRKVSENASSFNLAAVSGKFGRRLEGLDFSVLFNVRCAPPLLLHVGKDGVEVYEKDDALGHEADVVVVSDMATLSRIKDKQGGIRRIFGALLTGKLKIRGKLTRMWGLYRNMWVLQEILGGKIT
jgi:predicted N-acetyltransferase YhbS